MKNDTPDLSLVIPCYNEEPVLEESIHQVVEIMDHANWSYEIIFVDDCSRDNTRDIILRLIQKYPDKDFRKLFHEHNRGRGRTVTDGVQMARGRVAGFIDIDLEVHARYIPSMMIALGTGAEMVFAERIYKLHIRFFHRHFFSRGYRFLVCCLLGVQLRDTESGFKFFDRKKILPILDEIEDDGWFWDTEVVVRADLAGLRIVEIPCLLIRRYDKESTVNLLRDISNYLVKLWKFRKVVRQIRACTSTVALKETDGLEGPKVFTQHSAFEEEPNENTPG